MTFTPSLVLIFVGLLLAIASLVTPRVPLALAVILIAIGLLVG
jgi:hypothetical protein